MDGLIVAGAVAGALLVLVVLGVWGLPWLARKQQGYPGEAQIEPVLIPALYQAICAAYKVSERAVDEFGARMGGVDKAAVAAGLYPLLPEKLRALATEAQWAWLVQASFDKFLGFYGDAAKHLDAEFAQWAETWGPWRWNLELDDDSATWTGGAPESAGMEE